MNIIINGEDKSFEEGITLKSIIDSLQIEDKIMAAAVNMEIVKKDQWNEFILQKDDKLELLSFVGGG
jgi:sulfur carrier protein